jgi:hypothetical protein
MPHFEVEITEKPPVVIDPGNDLGRQSTVLRHVLWSDDVENEAAALQAAWRKWDTHYPGPRPEPERVDVRVKLLPAPR